MRLASLTEPRLIFADVPGQDGRSVLRALAGRIAQQGVVGEADRLFEKLWEREQLGSTGIGSGVAIPHCKLRGLREVVLAIGIAECAVDFGSVDGQPVRLFFLVISPSETPAAHLQSLAAISKWVKADHHVERILELESSGEIYELLGEGGLGSAPES
jgi:PTS system nitrogen regulatory IIA component